MNINYDIKPKIAQGIQDYADAFGIFQSRLTFAYRPHPIIPFTNQILGVNMYAGIFTVQNKHSYMHIDKYSAQYTELKTPIR